MASKSDFTPDEWNKILESPMLSGMAITAADPHGLWGALKESMATAHALLGGKTNGGSGLIQAVVADYQTSEGRTAVQDGLRSTLQGIKPPDVKEKAIAALRDVSALIDAKAPADAPAFKAWLRNIAQSTADAAKEGGFLGFGGVQVSDAEKATLSEVSNALSLPA